MSGTLSLQFWHLMIEILIEVLGKYWYPNRPAHSNRYISRDIKLFNKHKIYRQKIFFSTLINQLQATRPNDVRLAQSIYIVLIHIWHSISQLQSCVSVGRRRGDGEGVGEWKKFPLQINTPECCFRLCNTCLYYSSPNTNTHLCWLANFRGFFFYIDIVLLKKFKLGFLKNFFITSFLELYFFYGR